MRHALFIPIVLAVALALVIGVLLFFPQVRSLLSGLNTSSVSDTQVQVPPLTETYKNDTLRFTFKYPEGYSVREVTDTEGTNILIENKNTRKGVQIYVTPYTDSDTTITKERVEEEVGDMAVGDPQPIVLSAGSGEGLAFRSDNPDFGGSSREAWFIVAGHLYQISTYAEYDEFLKVIFATWAFF